MFGLFKKEIKDLCSDTSIIETLEKIDAEWKTNDNVLKAYTYACRVNLLDGSIEFTTSINGYNSDRALDALKSRVNNWLDLEHGGLTLERVNHEWNYIAFPREFIKNVEFKSTPIEVKRKEG